MEKRNCISTMVLAAIFAFFLVQCNKLSVTAAYWPRIICIVGLALAALELLLEGIKWCKKAKGGEKQKALWPLNREQTLRSLILLGVMVLWIMGLKWIGFMVSSAVALAAIAVVFEPVKTRNHILRDVLIGAGFAVLFYFVFKLLGIHFPKTLLM